MTKMGGNLEACVHLRMKKIIIIHGNHDFISYNCKNITIDLKV